VSRKQNLFEDGSKDLFEVETREPSLAILLAVPRHD
jgi:hypothetical protein